MDGLMTLALVIFCFLIVTIAIFGIWSAVKIAFYFAVAALVVGAGAFYVLRPGDSKSANIDGALGRLLLAGLTTFIAFRVAQPYAFVGVNFDAARLETPEYEWLRDKVPETWYTLSDKLPSPLRAWGQCNGKFGASCQ